MARIKSDFALRSAAIHFFCSSSVTARASPSPEIWGLGFSPDTYDQWRTLELTKLDGMGMLYEWKGRDFQNKYYYGHHRVEEEKESQDEAGQKAVNSCNPSATLFTIQIGSITLEDEDPNRVTLTSSEYIIHPDYNPDTLENDLGLIKLNETFAITPTSQPIAWLPTTPLDNETIVSVFGWGQTSDDGPLPVNLLHWNTVTALNNEDCRLIYGNQLKDNMVCVAGDYNNKTRTCSGDSGGPLVQYYGSVNDNFGKCLKTVLFLRFYENLRWRQHLTLPSRTGRARQRYRSSSSYT
ncbi:hypothetical protein GEV33_001711 [Tenebrio molitor]|uniref:Peptidase S1 domain-containing protein n=1 Tax=Tenebrio molitor TaxID=7067 RepID=A0A8J6LFP4_TENMO|nr:hypothetical protein GEV33_001711 [Tenebrio molitor]